MPLILSLLSRTNAADETFPSGPDCRMLRLDLDTMSKAQIVCTFTRERGLTLISDFIFYIKE
jgi:hypothetical protein